MTILVPPKFRALDSNGDPLSGGKLFTYEPGSTTDKDTYSDSALTTPNTNPVVLNANGEAEIYGSGPYRLVLKDSLDNLQWDIDNVVGIQALSSSSLSEWVSPGSTPTYVSGTSFTVEGDQTSTYQPGRRFRATVTAGTVYGTIKTSVYTSLTTITVSMDSGSLDSGISTVDVGLLSVTNPAVPSDNNIHSITITPGSDADVTLTPSQYVFKRLILADGSWTSGHNIIVPDDEREYFIDNSSGTYDATIKTSSGTGVVVKAGFSQVVSCDGTNVVYPTIQDINGQTAESSIATSDEVLIYDASVAANRKTTIANVRAALFPAAQADIGPSAVGQGELKSTTASQSTSIAATSHGEITLTGGDYTMGWFAGENATTSNFDLTGHSGTYLPRVAAYNNSGGSLTFYVYSRYIQASPPWDLGYGEIPLFIFALLDKTTKEVLGTYVAEDPPWAYHGPHNLHPIDGVVEKAVGLWGRDVKQIIKFGTEEDVDKVRLAKEIKNDPAQLQKVRKSISFSMEEKNADMDIVPHLFSEYDPSKHVVVLLDPCSEDTERLSLLGGGVGEMLHDGSIEISNTEISERTPSGVVTVKYRIK